MNYDLLTNLLSSWFPSFVGSAGALLWMEGSTKRLTGLFILGAFFGIYAGKYVSIVYGLPEEVCGFVVGLFSMSIADKLFKTLGETNLSELITGFFQRFLK